MLSTLWFGALTSLLLEINHLFPDALPFPFLTSGCLYPTHVHGKTDRRSIFLGCRAYITAPLAVTVLYIIFRDFKNIKVHIKILTR
jgi:hypothetical protein